MKKSNLFIGMFLIMSINLLSANYITVEYLSKIVDTTISDIRFCGGLTHQHQDFYNKTFSIQGIEAGFIVNHKLILGADASSFATKLEVELNNKTADFSTSQTGILIRITDKDQKFIYSGFLINIVDVSILENNTGFTLFQAKYPAIDIRGLVISQYL
jgi:hypothetical protein